MVLVIASPQLAPLQSRSEWVLFSFPVLWVWCLFPMFWHHCQTHALKSFMIISLSDDYTVSKSLSRSFVSFFFFVTLVYVHCDGDIDGVGRRHSVYQGKTSDFGFSERPRTPQRETPQCAPVPAAQGCPSCHSPREVGPSPVVPWAMSAVFLVAAAPRGVDRVCHCHLPHAHDRVRGFRFLAQGTAKVWAHVVQQTREAGSERWTVSREGTWPTASSTRSESCCLSRMIQPEQVVEGRPACWR